MKIFDLVWNRGAAAGLAVFLLATALGAQVPQYTVKSVAGNGASGFSGDNGAATSAQLADPYAIAFDTSGNFYIADQANHRIRKVTSGGTISTIAGTGTASYSGDNDAATAATLHAPCGIWVDKAGIIYIADTMNTVIRKITTDGKIATIVGDNTPGYTTDSTAANGSIAAVNVAATSARIYRAMGLAMDSTGNLFIADTINSLIRRVDTAGYIWTVAGDGETRYFGDGGPATGATLFNPQGVAVDSTGNFYIADTNNHVIRKVDASGNISTIAGLGFYGYSGDEGPATRAALFYPKGVAVDSAGNVFIADTFNAVIRMVDTSGNIHTVAGTGRFGLAGDAESPALQAELLFPSSVTFDPNGTLYVTDTENHRILRLTKVVPVGLVAPTSLLFGNTQYVSAVAGDGRTPVLPSTADPSLQGRPARQGETITLYAVGMGGTQEEGQDMAGRMQIYFGRLAARVTYAGPSADTPGVQCFSVEVPNVEDSDKVPVTLSVNGSLVRQALYTAVRYSSDPVEPASPRGAGGATAPQEIRR